MNHPRSSTNSYMSKEYSYKSKIGSEMPTNESRYHSNESDSMWQNSIRNNTATLPLRMSTHHQSNSLNRVFNTNNMTSSTNYVVNEPNLQWQNNNTRIEERMMTDSPTPVSGIHNINSSQMTPNINDNRDQFSIFGSFKKHLSEKGANSIRCDSSKIIETHQTNYKNLPVKQQSTMSYSSSDFEVPVNAGLTSSGFFTPQIQPRLSTLQDLLAFNIIDDEKKGVVEETPVKAEAQKQNFSSLPSFDETSISDTTAKDQEIKKLNKTVDKLNNKMKALQQNNEEMKNHLKNLLNERKNLIKQIENSEFEEIIEEEEVQKAKPNMIANENSNQQKSVGMKEEYIRENYVEKNKVSLHDLPQHILNNYRQEIIENEREKMELEKRTLMNTLNIQYQQQLQSLKHEQEVRKTQVKHVSIQSYRNKKFNQTVTDVNNSRTATPPRSIVTVFQPATSSKQSQNEMKKEITKKFNQTASDVDLSRVGTFPKSIVTLVQPKTATKQSQNELREEINKKLAKDTYTHFTNHIKRRQIQTTDWQNSILQRLIESLEESNSEKLSFVIEEILFKSSKNIVTSAEPMMASKQSQNETMEEINKTISREVSKSLNDYIKKSQIKTSNWQNVMLERFLHSLLSNNIDSLSSVMQEILFKPTKSVEIHSQPAMVSKLSQNEVIETDSKLAKETFMSFSKSIKKSRVVTTQWQDSILERLMDSLKTNNSEKLSSLIEELLFKPSKTIGINSVPDYSNKNSQTQLHNFNNVSYEVSIVDEKPKIEKASKSILVKPMVFQKGTQPEEKFYFETGTMTDHLFYRSQGVNTLYDYSKNLHSPYSETDSYVTRTSSRSEAKKEIKSQTVIQSSTSNVQKPLQKLQEKTEIKIEPKSKDLVEEWEQTIIVKDMKGSNEKSSSAFDNCRSNLKEETVIKSQSNVQETIPKPKEKIEEWEQNIEEKVQVITAHVDKNQNLKDDTQTTVECWETISKIKDGKLIEKKECYRDKYVSSNPEEILKHLESHNREHTHSEDKHGSEKTIDLNKNFHQNKERSEIKTVLSGDMSQKLINETENVPGNSRMTETRYSKGTTSSSNIPIIKKFGESETSKFRNYTSVTSAVPVGVTRHEVSATVEERSKSLLRENFTVSERIEQSSSSKSFNSPTSFTSFSSRSSNIISNSDASNQKQIEIKSSGTNSKQKVLPKPIKIQNSESIHSRHGINIDVKTFSPTVESSGMYVDETNNSTVIGSNNSAFYSISDLPKPMKDNQNYDYHEVLLPENIFQLSSQVLLWLNSSKHVCLNNIEHMPHEMVGPSLMLIDWWVDMVIKLTPNQLLTTVQYLISTFNKNFVKFLIINRDQQGNTCMHYIIGHQFWGSFSVLYATGLVDPNIYNVQGFTVMMLAATLQVSDDILNSHIQKLSVSSNLNLQSKEQGQTAIYLAALHDNDNTIITLYTLGADINVRDKDENTPLMIAVVKNNINAVKAILTCPGVLLELKNKEGKTALKIAEQNNFSEIVNLFDQRRSMRRSEMSVYSKTLQSNSNPTSPRTFRKFTYN